MADASNPGADPRPGAARGGGATHLAPGTVLAGRYRLEEPGTSDLPHASVWRAHDQILARSVRVVVLTGPRSSAALDGARRAALVADPRLVRVLDVGTTPATPTTGAAALGYVVTEPVDGRTLDEMVAHGPLTPDQARAVVGEAATALEAARRRGVHHLALRPAALVVTPAGRVVVTGLGLDGDLLGRTADSAGTTSRADTVALVQLLYAALTGRWPAVTAATTPTPPFSAWDAAMLRSDAADPAGTAPSSPDIGLPAAPEAADGPLPPADLAADVPADLDTLCAVTLGPNDDGPHSPGELVRELEPWGAVRAAGPRWPTLGIQSARPTAPVAREKRPVAAARPGGGTAAAGDALRAEEAPSAAGPAAAAPVVPAPSAPPVPAPPVPAPPVPVPSVPVPSVPAVPARPVPPVAAPPARPAEAAATPAASGGRRSSRASDGVSTGPVPAVAPADDAQSSNGQDVPSATPPDHSDPPTPTGSSPMTPPDGPAPTSDDDARRPTPDAAKPESDAPAPTPVPRQSVRASFGGQSTAGSRRPGTPPPATPASPSFPAAAASTTPQRVSSRPGGAATVPMAGTTSPDPVEPAPRASEPTTPDTPWPAGTPERPVWDLTFGSAATPPPAQAEKRFDPTRWVLGIVAAAVVVGVIIAANALFRPFTPSDGPDAVVTPEVAAPQAEQPADTAPEGEPPAEAPAEAVPPAIAGVTSLDPSDGDGEHEELIGRLVDGDPATSWYSHTYNRPDFAGFKDAVGIVITLAQPATVTSVNLTVNGSGGMVEVRATDAANPTAGAVLAAGPLSPSTVLTFSAPTQTQSIVLWFTSLAQTPDGANRIEINELSVS